MFAQDNLVVYPAQGVGRIERIDRKEINGEACDFYVVRIRSNNITLLVPVHNAANVGLRNLVSETRALEIMEMLNGSAPDREIMPGQNWNRRFREYSKSLKSTDLLEVANVLKELLLIGRSKDLSFGERRLLEQAMSLVSGELSEVLATSADSLREELLARYAQESIGEPA